MDAIWKETAQLPSFRSLEEDLQTQVLVIGGGMTGLLCAYFLRQAGVDCVLAEAGKICGSTTGNTTAKITAQHGLLYDRLIREQGLERADMFLRANLRALETYRQLSRQIPCRFEEKNAYVFSRTDQGALEQELRALEKLRYPARFADALKLPFSTVGAVCFPHQAQFHPLQFAAAIASGAAADCMAADGTESCAEPMKEQSGNAERGLCICENTRIVGVEGQEARAQNGRRIRAEKIIFATHFPIVNSHGLYFVKMYQQRSYVLALAGAPPVEGMYREDAEDGFSFRTAGDLLLVGGGGHRTGKCGGGYEALRQFAGRFYPRARECAGWAAQDCISLDKIPYIGRYAGQKREWYVATGFNKWGMTSAMAAAQILTDQILGKENDCAAVFSPNRRMKKPQLLANAMEAAADLAHFGKKRCSHMGCALHYNSAEHSWDCPCHGSRFSGDGRIMQEPALRAPGWAVKVGGEMEQPPAGTGAKPGRQQSTENGAKPGRQQSTENGAEPDRQQSTADEAAPDRRPAEAVQQPDRQPAAPVSDQPAAAQHEQPEGEGDGT